MCLGLDWRKNLNAQFYSLVHNTMIEDLFFLGEDILFLIQWMTIGQ